ncbi:MAG: DMT family transporter [Calditrichaeota bacterium]|nr:DMT family transporter [Candidatus Cloacimonadota bacterium]MCA9785087.1 DMT family transporter [Candidatus Cloacimonadota bacterium]MCB1046819.1 DMT family transporter [Calditrichota bacterium]MCB9473506.1 DMT family transporter [Candidatus Delongbacteria bacterium]
MPLNPWLAVAGAVLCVGWSAIFIRWAGEAHPFTIAFWRLAIAFAFWLPFWFRARRIDARPLSVRQSRARLAAGLFLGIHFILWITAFSWTTVASAVFLMLTQPILSALGAHLFLGERLNRWNGVAIGLTVLGSGIICWGDLTLGPEYLFGDLLALTGAAASTAYLLMARIARPARPGQQALALGRYLAPVYLSAGIACGLAMLLAGASPGPFQPVTMLSLLALGLIPTVIGHSLFNYALGHLPSFSVNISLVGEPLISSLLAWWLLAEAPTPSLLLGGLVLISAIGFVLRWPPHNPLAVLPVD